MSKTNKELAVEMYIAFSNISAGMVSSPNFKGAIQLPTVDDMVATVAELTQKLSSIDDN